MSDLIRVTRGVWRPRDQSQDLAARCAALLSSVGPDAVVGGQAAALLHGLWLPNDKDRIDLLIRTDSARPREHAHSKRTEFRCRRRVVSSDEIVTVAGLPVTSEARTWVDLAQDLDPPDLVAAGDSALRGSPTTLTDLGDAVSRAIGQRGIRRARQVLPILDARSRSRPESHLRYALVSAGLPGPDVNEAIHVDGEWLAEPDLSYKDVRLALEYNGSEHAQLNRMRRDITRAVGLGARGGWRTEVFGPVEVFQRPEQVAGYVRRLRHERARIFGLA